jgi:hypothetical protein
LCDKCRNAALAAQPPYGVGPSIYPVFNPKTLAIVPKSPVLISSVVSRHAVIALARKYTPTNLVTIFSEENKE